MRFLALLGDVPFLSDVLGKIIVVNFWDKNIYTAYARDQLENIALKGLDTKMCVRLHGSYT